MDTKGLQLEFISWCKSKKKSPKTEEETKLLFHAFMKEKHPKEYEAAMKQSLQNQTQKAAHGAKLQYIKNLKHQCADDEELYYYKKGGSVNCGCKKKEDGGEVVKAGVGTALAIAAFKEYRKRKAAEEAKKKNTWGATSKIVGKDYEKGQEDAGPKSKVLDSAVPKEDIPSHDKPKFRNVRAKNDHMKCGGAVAKFKMHRLGGSLNGIPFMQKGTPKGGIDWYKSTLSTLTNSDSKGGTYLSTIFKRKKSKSGDTFDRTIQTYYSPNRKLTTDTTYTLHPINKEPQIGYSFSLGGRRLNYEKLRDYFNKIVSTPISPYNMFFR